MRTKNDGVALYGSPKVLLQKERFLRKWRYFGRKQYNFHVMYTLFCQSAAFILPSVAFHTYELAKCQSGIYAGLF